MFIFFLQVVWDILTSSLYEAKMGVSYFYPWISFPMKCQVGVILAYYFYPWISFPMKCQVGVILAYHFYHVDFFPYEMPGRGNFGLLLLPKKNM
jgi:hypothetical protein